MATADQIKSLVQSHITGDDEPFYSVALQVAATEARLGHTNLARELRDMVDEARQIPRVIRSPTRATQPGMSLVAQDPHCHLEDLRVQPAIGARLACLLREQQSQERLRVAGLRPRNRLLLLGPPGSGKTLTAEVIAGELKIPLFTIPFEFLLQGETGLRLIFDAVHRTRGVYLFDKFDATVRGVLSPFLRLLEQEASLSVLVVEAEGSIPRDLALFRFDDVIEYGMPTPDLAEEAIRARLLAFKTHGMRWCEVQSAAEGLSYAEIAKACNNAIKLAILDEKTEITTESLTGALRERATLCKFGWCPEVLRKG